MLELREAGPDDHADVQHLHAQHTGQNYLAVRNYESWLGKCTLAVDGGEVLGFCLGNHDSGVWGNVVVTPDPPEHWNCSYITHLVVDAGYRRHGIGSILLRNFLEQAERAGNTWVILNPGSQTEGQTEADLHAFYGANGFRHLRHRSDDGDPEGREVDHYMLGYQVGEDDRYEVAVLDGPFTRESPDPPEPESAADRDHRARIIKEYKRRLGAYSNGLPPAESTAEGRRRGF